MDGMIRYKGTVNEKLFDISSIAPEQLAGLEFYTTSQPPAVLWHGLAVRDARALDAHAVLTVGSAGRAWPPSSADSSPAGSSSTPNPGPARAPSHVPRRTSSECALPRRRCARVAEPTHEGRRHPSPERRPYGARLEVQIGRGARSFGGVAHAAQCPARGGGLHHEQHGVIPLGTTALAKEFAARALRMHCQTSGLASGRQTIGRHRRWSASCANRVTRRRRHVEWLRGPSVGHVRPRGRREDTEHYQGITADALDSDLWAG
jgi:hypothetical protein